MSAIVSFTVRVEAAAPIQKVWKARVATALWHDRSGSTQTVASVPREGVLESAGECVGKWCAVTYKGKRGWVDRSHLVKVDTPAGARAPRPYKVALVTAVPAPRRPRGLTPAALEIYPDASASPVPPQEAAFPRYWLAGLGPEATLPMREGPAGTSRVVGALPAESRDIKDMKACFRQWCLVEHGGVKGYILRRYLGHLTERSGQRYQIGRLPFGDTVEVLDYPGSGANRVGELPFYSGGIVPIGDCDANWCHIRYLGLVGWVKTPMLAPEGIPLG